MSYQLVNLSTFRVKFFVSHQPDTVSFRRDHIWLCKTGAHHCSYFDSYVLSFLILATYLLLQNFKPISEQKDNLSSKLWQNRNYPSSDETKIGNERFFISTKSPNMVNGQ